MIVANNEQNIFSVIQSIIIINKEITFQIVDLKTVEYIDFMAAYKLKEIESMPKLLSFEKYIRCSVLLSRINFHWKVGLKFVTIIDKQLGI